MHEYLIRYHRNFGSCVVVIYRLVTQEYFRLNEIFYDFGYDWYFMLILFKFLHEKNTITIKRICQNVIYIYIYTFICDKRISSSEYADFS